MTRFVVDLGDIALPKETQAKIASDVQKLVLGHIAEIRFEKPFITKFPKEWWGLVARLKLEHLLEGEQQIGHALATIKASM